MKNNELLTTITYDLIMSMRPCYEPMEIGMSADYSASVIDFIKDYRTKVKDLRDIQWVIRRRTFLTGKESAIYALFCANQVRHLMKDKRSINALDIAERYLNGNATIEELRAAKRATDADVDAADATAIAAFAVATATAFAADVAAATAIAADAVADVATATAFAADADVAAATAFAADAVAAATADVAAATAIAADAVADVATATAFAADADVAAATADVAAATAIAADAVAAIADVAVAAATAFATAKNKMINIQIDKLIEILEERDNLLGVE